MAAQALAAWAAAVAAGEGFQFSVFSKKTQFFTCILLSNLIVIPAKAGIQRKLNHSPLNRYST
ncbi:MAG: hypothetical protein R3B84_15110 [Zavarzinella sp.]